MNDDELMGSTDAELFKIEEKERESKEDNEEEWTKNNEDSEEESIDNGTRENDTDDRSENSNVSMIDETEENSGEVEEGEWNKIGPNKRKAPNQRKNKSTRTITTTRMWKGTTNKDQSVYYELVITINQDNKEDQLRSKVVEEEEKKEEEEVQTRALINTQRVIQFEIMTLHHYQQHKKIKSITSNSRSIQR